MAVREFQSYVINPHVMVDHDPPAAPTTRRRLAGAKTVRASQ
jgi:hypothetical protein